MNEGVVKRASAALAVGVVLVLTLFLTLAPVGAQSQGNPPSVECDSADPAWNGKYFKVQVNNGALTGDTEGSGSIELVGTTGVVPWTNTDSDTVFRVVLKVGQGVGTDSVVSGWWPSGEGSTVDVGTVGLSHITWCFANPVNQTTTTTAGNTTTTAGNTTTTAGNTTTTAGNTTTTAGNTTTTGANTTSTVAATTTTPPPTTATEDTTSVLGVQVTTTSVSAETLPLTGADMSESGLVGFALALLSLGGIALLAIRRRESELEVLESGWSARLWDVE